ncbi:MAG: hypothetical protein H0V67_07035 [Geodermatophilaceae bacterium]|nr:hypothetical protein [Geodermatophilaceae bacterium]
MNTDFIDINLLPHTVRPTIGGPAWRRLMLPGLGLLFLSLMLLFGAWRITARNEQALAEQRAALEALGENVQEFSAVSAEVDVLQQQITTLASQTRQLQGDAERVGTENPALAPFLRALVEESLPRMSVTSIVPDGTNRYIVQGEAGSASLVIEYANALRQRGEIRAVTPRSVDDLDDGAGALPGAVRWTLVVER